jgi:putative FmdB family regulatory protein
MPTYDYECQACGHRFEHFQSMTDKVLRKCPACGQRKLKRLIGPGAGFLFHGSGFYITDYRSESYKAGEKAEKSAATPSGGKGTAPKTGSKPRSKSEKKADKKPAGKASS